MGIAAMVLVFSSPAKSLLIHCLRHPTVGIPSVASFAKFGIHHQQQQHYSSTAVYSEKRKAVKPKEWKLKRVNTSLSKNEVLGGGEREGKGNKPTTKKKKTAAAIKIQQDEEEEEKNDDLLPTDESSLRNGLVLERLGSRLLVELEAKSTEPPQILQCNQRTYLSDTMLVPGDVVVVDISSIVSDVNGVGMVVGSKERKNLLQRPSSNSNSNKIQMKAIASNIDQVCIVYKVYSV